MLGKGKYAWQAEIDAAAERPDFFRFNVGFAQEIYDKQPTINSPGHHGRTDWRPLEGFVYAVSPFNFTAIGGNNLTSAPALMGNVVVWKPSAMSVYPSYLVHKILLEAGLPPGVISSSMAIPRWSRERCLGTGSFPLSTSLGSSSVFQSFYGKAAEGVVSNRYRDFPRMVGETSRKNFHSVHRSADIENAVQVTLAVVG